MKLSTPLERACSVAAQHGPGRQYTRRPGRVVGLRGVLFQYDNRDAFSDWLVHPFEQLDRRVAGLRPRFFGKTDLAVHTGLHLEVEVDGERREVVAEQLLGQTLPAMVPNLLCNGLHWTPLEDAARRDHGGWHLTIPATAFRGVDEAAVREAIERLNRIEGRSFIEEDCVGFMERVFGGQRLFADSPLMSLLGLHLRVADPAMPLLRPDADLEPEARRRLRFDSLRRLPDALGRAQSYSTARRVSLGLLAALAALSGAALGNRLATRS